ncbi:cytochrome c oxidase subunit 7A, mitochondrial [Leptinotarsa decemlineata]|uniref:cytochrome c oxidase subunit 7A, mitochondrial n=1 Tax=Leptinotarsa decemlineata TaxID=7539 RepID=UPI000C25495C|nr:cytochrome c oxidase subunit 7A, mitochondrial [Leptinotarsa decemlineata]
MNKSVMMLHLARACQRQFARPASTDVIIGKSNQIQSMQKHFQMDNGEPVFLKKGFGDKALYQVTIALTIIGLGMSGHTLYQLTFKD